MVRLGQVLCISLGVLVATIEVVAGSFCTETTYLRAGASPDLLHTSYDCNHTIGAKTVSEDSGAVACRPKPLVGDHHQYLMHDDSVLQTCTPSSRKCVYDGKSYALTQYEPATCMLTQQQMQRLTCYTKKDACLATCTNTSICLAYHMREEGDMSFRECPESCR